MNSKFTTPRGSLFLLAFCTVLTIDVRGQVTNPPVIATQPESQFVFAGIPTKLSVTATNTSWIVFPTTTSGTANASTNILAASQSSGTVLIDYDFFLVPDTLHAYYEGSRIFDSGLVNGAGTFVINFGPGNSSNVTIVVNEGDSPYLNTFWTYTASKPFPITYQWRKDGGNISGATNATLTITKAEATDAGVYSVVAANSFGSVTSQLATLTVAPVMAGAAPSFGWALRAGGNKLDSTTRLAVDKGGNCYLTGQIGADTFLGTNLIASGGFITKCNSRGEFVWTKQLGASGQATAVDSAGNCYVTGFFSGTADFGGTSITAIGNQDVFVAKYDGQGGLLWAQQAGGDRGSFTLNAGISICADSQGNCFVTGSFQSAILNCGGILLTNYTGGGSDIFVIKYSSTGTVVWAISAGGVENDAGYGIGLDGSGNIYVGGVLNSFSAFFGGVLVTNGAAGGFLAKFDNGGHLMWANRMAANGHVDGLAVDADGNCFFTGFAVSPGNFENLTLTTAGTGAGFLAKYDNAGHGLWLRQTGQTDEAIGRVVALDEFGNCFVSGRCYSTNLIIGGPLGGVALTNQGPSGFVAKFTSDGTPLWIKAAGGNSSNADVYGMGADAAGNCYVSGFFDGPIVILGDTVLTNSGGTDIFLARIEADSPKLSFRYTGGSLVLSWPAAAASGFVLETSGVLSSSGPWTAVTNDIVISVNNYFVTIKSESVAAFYRLHKR